MVRTLNSMYDLIDSGYGLPRPRHGLHLLYWFARNYIRFDMDNTIQALFSPDQGDFGFHRFQNRPEFEYDNYDRLLPQVNYRYYEVGNLQLQKSSSLPPYVRKNFTGHLDSSNKDRIIISMSQGMQVDKVYVTQHDASKSFDHENTFRISRGLLMSICKMTVDDFMHEAGYFTVSRPIVYRYESSSPIPREYNAFRLQSGPVPQQSRGFWDYVCEYCTIL